MLFFGTRHKAIQKRVSGVAPCRQCGHANKLSVVVDYDYSHLYWIFRSVKNVRTFLVCQNCDHSQEADDRKLLFEKLGGNPIPYTDRFGGVVLVMLVAGFFGYGFLSQAHRDSTGAIDRAGELDAFAVQQGDCFNDADSSDTDDADEVTSLNAMPCADPHDNEVFAVFDLELSEYPGDDAIFDMAYEECVARFETYVERDYQTSALEISILFPTSQSWNALGDREIACFLFQMDLSQMQGSMKGTGI